MQEWAKNQGLELLPTGEGRAVSRLTKEEILHAANYQFDIWAGGYNWLQSNRDSGAAIKEAVENVILPYYNEGKKVTVKEAPGWRRQERMQHPA